MKIASCVRSCGGVLIGSTFLTVGLVASPQSAADNGMVEVNFCVVDQTGQNQANVPVALQSQGSNGGWYLERQGDSGPGCGSFYRAPAPATYRITTAANNTGACQGATQAFNVAPGPQVNFGNLTLACTIQGPVANPGPVTSPVDVWLDYDLDGILNGRDRWPRDPSRY